MHFQYNPDMWIYLVSAVILLIAVAYTSYRRVADRLWIITQLMVIYWCLGYVLLVSATDLNIASFWYLTANDFIGWKTPVVWFIRALMVSGRKDRVSRFSVMLLLVLPVITDILNLTNSWHGMVYRRMWIDTSSDYPTLLFNGGPWYWVITAYCCFLLLAVIFVHLKAVMKRELLYPIQGMTVAAATAAVLVLICLNIIAQDLIFGGYDLTPVMIGAAAVITGLTFRFRTQEALPVPRNAVMENMTSAVLILDNNDRIMDLNPAAEVFFGLKVAKTAGHSMEEALRDWPELSAANRDKSITHCEFSRDGRHYAAYFSDLNDGQKATGYIVIIQDITAKKEVEEQFIQQQRALLVLQERERLARELHDSLGQVLGYTNIQIQVIKDMLEKGQLTEIESNLVRLSQVVTEANTEVREFIYEVKTTLLFKEGFFSALQQYLDHYELNFQIRVKMQNPDNIVEDDLDLSVGVQLFRIIQEALTNVRKHARAGKVTIVFHKKDTIILISIVDDGIGFNPKEFSSVQSSFGLEVMRERAGQIGGDILIDTAPGKGTVVTITIPRFATLNNKAETKGSETDTEPKDSRIRVLLADDHLLFMEGLRNLINQKGFEVVGMARDGLEALEKARLMHPEMILMDLQMPRCSGMTATQLIKAEMPEVKIIILTISDREQDLFTAIKNGASGYLLKGLSINEFIEQLYDLASNNSIVSPGLAARVLDECEQNGYQTDEGIEYNMAVLEKYLSKRQIEILSLLAKQYTYKEIAAELFISERTVKYQMSDILKILNLQTRRQAIEYARKAGLGKENGSQES